MQSSIRPPISQRKEQAHMDDPEIITLYFSRDETAIPQTAAKYGTYCYTIAYNILASREDCEECVNDTWWNAWNAIPPNQPAHLKLFLARITRNLAFNRFHAMRAQKRGSGEMMLALDELAETIPDGCLVQDTLEAKELTHCINRFLRTLPERDCGIFLKRYFHVMPVHEIAAQHRLSEKHTSTILSRTRRKLAAYLKNEGYFI